MKKPSLFQSFGFALKGIGFLLKSERNFRLECAALLINIILLLILRVSRTDAAIILTLSSGVLSAEMINTALEKLCDRIEPGHDRTIGSIKDISAGAVLLLVSASVVTALLVYPKYLVL